MLLLFIVSMLLLFVVSMLYSVHAITVNSVYAITVYELFLLNTYFIALFYYFHFNLHTGDRLLLQTEKKWIHLKILIIISCMFVPQNASNLTDSSEIWLWMDDDKTESLPFRRAGEGEPNPSHFIVCVWGGRGWGEIILIGYQITQKGLIVSEPSLTGHCYNNRQVHPNKILWVHLSLVQR